MPSEWNVIQNKGLHVHVESTREFSHTAKWQRKGDDVTRRKQKHSRSCVHAEAKRCTVGNFPDVETRVGNVRRELRNLKTGQQENKRENAGAIDLGSVPSNSFVP